MKSTCRPVSTNTDYIVLLHTCYQAIFPSRNILYVLLEIEIKIYRNIYFHGDNNKNFPVQR